MCNDGNVEKGICYRFNEIFRLSYLHLTSVYFVINFSYFNYKGNPSCGKDEDYNADCCTTSNQCGIGQGGCTTNEQCGANANLECVACTVHTNFPTGAKCCQIIGLLKNTAINNQ